MFLPKKSLTVVVRTELENRNGSAERKWQMFAQLVGKGIKKLKKKIWSMFSALATAYVFIEEHVFFKLTMFY